MHIIGIGIRVQVGQWKHTITASNLTSKPLGLWQSSHFHLQQFLTKKTVQMAIGGNGG